MPNSEDYVTREEYNEERKNVNNKLSEHDKKIAELETVCNNLKGVPERISKLETNIAVMGTKIDNFGDMILRIDSDLKDYIIKKENEDKKQSKKINEIDDKSKVDILQWIRENWISIVAGVIIGFLAINGTIK